MDVSSEPTGRGIKVTIKYGKGYEHAWAAFLGLAHEVRQDVIAYFGLEETDGLTLSEVVLNASQLAQGKGLAATKLGAVALSPGQQAASGGDVWDAAASGSEGPSGASGGASEGPSPEEQEVKRILALIEATTDTDALKRVWAENQAAFSLPGVMDAYKAKGKSLKGSV